MGKIFGITSYIILIVFTTFIVAGYARANQTVTFLEEQKLQIYEEPKDLISATLIANTQGQFDIYIKNEPIIDVDISQPNYSYRLMIYAVLLYQSNHHYHYEIVILINDYENTDPFAFISEDALTLKIDIVFESNPEGFNQSVFREQLIQLYDDSMHMYSIDQRHFINETKITRIERVEILYPTEFIDVSSAKLINTSVYQDKNLTTPDLYQADLNNMEATNIQLESIADKDMWYVNRALNKTFQSYGYFSYLYIGIEVLIFIPITYFTFFHKNIKRIKKNKETSKWKKWSQSPH